MDISMVDVGGNESFDCNSIKSDSPTNAKIIKRRSALERQLETNLTSKITSPAADSISPNTSRYGRARKTKKNEDFYETDKEVAKAIKSPPMLSETKVSVSSKALKMNAAKSPLKTVLPQNNIEQKYENQPNKSLTEMVVPNSNAKFTNGHSENIPNQNDNNQLNNILTNKPIKVYVRKDLIQNRIEKTSNLIKNMFSPPKSTSLNGSTTLPILDKLPLENGDCNRDVSPKTKHAYVDHSGSVVKALDFTENQNEKKKTIIERSDFIKKTTDMDSVIAERLDEELCPWKDGDVLWARIGSYPFWPCLITRDPYSKKYLKRKILGRSTNVTYILHVTFFADNGRRGWVMSNMLMMFEGLEEFKAEKERITLEQRKKDPKHFNAFTVSQNKLRKWNDAVNEAEMILRRPAEYRVDFFNDLFSKRDEKLERLGTPQKVPKKKLKPENANISLSESLFDSLFASENEISVSEKVKNKSRNNSFDVSDVVTACIDDIATKVGNRKIQKQSHMDRWLQKAKSPNKVNDAKKSNKSKSEKRTHKSMSESIRAVTKNLNVELDSKRNKRDSNLTITDLVTKLDKSEESDFKMVEKSVTIYEKNGEGQNNVSDDLMEVSKDEFVIKSDDEKVQNNDVDTKNNEETHVVMEINDVNDVNKHEKHVQINYEEVKTYGGEQQVENIGTDCAISHNVDNDIFVDKFDNKDAKKYYDNVKINSNVLKNIETEVVQVNGINDERFVIKSDDENVKQGRNDKEYLKVSEKSDEKKSETEVIKINGVTDYDSDIKSDDEITSQGQKNDRVEENTTENNAKNNKTEVSKKLVIRSEKSCEYDEKKVETNAMKVKGVNDHQVVNEFDGDLKNNDVDAKINSEDNGLNNKELALQTGDEMDNCNGREKYTEENNEQVEDRTKIGGIVDSDNVSNVLNESDNVICNVNKENACNETEIETVKINTIERQSWSPEGQLNLTPLGQQNGSTSSDDEKEIKKYSKVLRSRKATASPMIEIKQQPPTSREITASTVEEKEVDNNKKILESLKLAKKSADDDYEEDKPTETETSSEGESEKEISPRKTGKIPKSKYDDLDFQHFLNIRRDPLMDENPDLSEDDLIEYLYKTWLYEETYKTHEMKNDDTQQLVKGLADETSVQTKKKRKQRAFVEKDIEKSTEMLILRDKPVRKSMVRSYTNDSESSDEELEDKPKNEDIISTTVEKTIIKVEKQSSSPSENTIKAYFSPQAKKPLENNKEIVIASEIEEDELDFYMKSLTKPKPNLFKGLLKEKVCEICETPGNLVKCKGSCGGVFHMNCVKEQLNSPPKEEESLMKKRGKKKKKYKKAQRKSEENDESQTEMDIMLDDSPKKLPDGRLNGRIKEENVSPNRRMSLTANALEFESQTAMKMQEIMTQTKYDTSDMDMFDSTEDECDWDRMEVGKCEIVDVKLKKNKEQIEIQEKTDLEKEIDSFKCNTCNSQDMPSCFVCKEPVAPKTDNEIRQKCNVSHCCKVYHLECLNMWPQTQFNSGAPSKNKRKISVHYEAITCPRHVCHTCVSDDPRGCKTRFSGDKLARCVRCPATYHSFTQCLPAGTRILTASQIVCPRHYEQRQGRIPYHVNTAWCFICASGGTLICCETCPTSFHAECLNISPPEEGYICEDCETGRLPLYGELVWVKLGNYRWWPGIILHPHEILNNIRAMKHVLGQFVVRFFGAQDHYWVNRGRVFPYQEGDTGHASTKKSAVDSSFILAIQQAAQAYNIIKKQKQSSVEPSDITSSLLPPHYVKLKVNKPCGSLAGRSGKADCEEDSLTQCHCDPDDEEPCGPHSDCLNRMLLTECGSACASEDRCRNRMFEKRQYPSLTPYRTPHRGWGLKTLEDVKRGQFVIEYVGEVIDEQEYRRRMKRKHEIKDENYYFLTLDKDRMIDAGPKGNAARFMNHCCEPNCETQKWTVNGDTRVGLFAINDIPANTEVTFNYNLECAGVDKKRCLCGAPRCSGYIGAKLKDDPELEKKKQKKLEQKQLKRKNKRKALNNSPSTSKKIKPQKISPQKPPTNVTRQAFSVTSSPIVEIAEKPLEKPLSKEMQEIENDLEIIRNATNQLNSTDNEIEIYNSNKNNVKSSLKNTSLNESDANSSSLKRKRVSFSSEEIIIYGSEIDPLKSPKVKVLRLQNCKKNGISKGKSEVFNGHTGDCLDVFTNDDEVVKKVKGRPRKSLPITT